MPKCFSFQQFRCYRLMKVIDKLNSMFRQLYESQTILLAILVLSLHYRAATVFIWFYFWKKDTKTKYSPNFMKYIFYYYEFLWFDSIDFYHMRFCIIVQPLLLNLQTTFGTYRSISRHLQKLFIDLYLAGHKWLGGHGLSTSSNIRLCVTF